MKKCALAARSGAWWGRVLAGLAVMAAVPMTALGADRVVLGEEFMATW